MFCYKCGANLPDNAAFCNSCGVKIPTNGTQKQENDAVSTNIQPETTETALFTEEETTISIGQAPQTESVVYVQQSSVSDSNSNISTVPAIAGVPTSKKKSKTPLIIAAAAILVIAAAITAFMLWKNSDSYNDTKNDLPFLEVPG